MKYANLCNVFILKRTIGAFMGYKILYVCDENDNTNMLYRTIKV